MPVYSADYTPRTYAEIRLTQEKYREISSLTHMPLAVVMKYGDNILDKTLEQTLKDIDKNIFKYVPKATGQLRTSLSKQLHHSNISNNRLQVKLGTFVHYMKYVANMSESKLRHPKSLVQKSLIRKRNTRRGKKGSAILNPGMWRWVNYYGGARWVLLNDPQAQHNFFSQLVLHIKTQLELNLANEIRSTFPSGKRRAWTDKFKVIKK